MDAKQLVQKLATLKLPTMRIKLVKPYENNPRKRTDASITKLADTISMVGFNVPIGIDENNVILYGHGRRLAAEKIGLQIVPYVQIPGLTDAQKMSFRIADNRASEESEWDGGKLEDELEAILKEVGGDALMAASAFDVDELTKMVDGFSTTIDVAVDPATEATTASISKSSKSDKKLPAADKQPTSIVNCDGDFVKLSDLIMGWYSRPGQVVLSPFVPIDGLAALATAMGRELHATSMEALPATVRADLLLGFPAPPAGDFPAWCAEYEGILAQAAARLFPGRFAVILIGDARNEQGALYGLPWLTVEYGLRAGMTLHDSAIVTLPPHGADEFASSRRLVPAHAHLFVFVMGDPQEAARAIS